MSNLYDRDFYAWANEQAALLRAGALAAADIDHIAEEIETLGRSEKRELVSRFEVLLLHLLKWRFQPERHGKSREVSIFNTRDALAVHMADNPSLKSVLPESVATAYRRARRSAGVETGLPDNVFPLDCPWTFDEAMENDIGEP